MARWNIRTSASDAAHDAATHDAHLGKCDATDLAGGNAGLLKSLLHKAHSPFLMVQRSLPRQETLPWRCDESAEQV
jgi:hypothetical protein